MFPHLFRLLIWNLILFSEIRTRISRHSRSKRTAHWKSILGITDTTRIYIRFGLWCRRNTTKVRLFDRLTKSCFFLPNSKNSLEAEIIIYRQLLGVETSNVLVRQIATQDSGKFLLKRKRKGPIQISNRFSNSYKNRSMLFVL